MLGEQGRVVIAPLIGRLSVHLTVEGAEFTKAVCGLLAVDHLKSMCPAGITGPQAGPATYSLSFLPGTALTGLAVALAAAAGLAAVVDDCTGVMRGSGFAWGMLLKAEHAVTASAVTATAMRDGVFAPIRTREPNARLAEVIGM